MAKIQCRSKEFINKACIVHNNNYDYSKVEYTNSINKVIIVCRVHGEFEQAPASHLRGRGCPKCSNNQRLSVDDCINRFKNIHGELYDYSKVIYKNKNNKVIIICRVHGEFKQTPAVHWSGHNCPKCAGRFKMSGEYLLDRAIIIHDDKYLYNNIPSEPSVGDKISIICHKHGEFKQNIRNHLRGQGCPLCPTIISAPHKVVEDIIKDFVYVNNIKTILPNNLEIDIYIPEFKIGIEINGAWYHGIRTLHSDKRKQTIKKKHAEKAKLAQEVGIKLFQFWDFEILKNKDLVRSMLLNAIGRSRKIYARNCDVKQISNIQSIQFLNENHLQGYRSASIVFGLYHNNVLVSVLSFSKHNTYEWEIMRFATKTNIVIIGGFSKLLSQFMSRYNPVNIMTFADNRFSIGNVYVKNGFTLLKKTDPNYFYIKGDKILSRQKCQKHKLPKLLGESFDQKLSETNNMLLSGYSKVYDAGHLCFILNKPDD